MDIVVGTKFLAAAVSTALDVSGREHLVIVAKATWQIPAAGQRARPIAPLPLAYTDEFHGEPGLSPMRYGADFARFKPRCDVLFDAVAHAPDGEPVRGLRAGFRVGTLQKEIKVLGPRRWKREPGRFVASAPEPFTEMPLHYGFAYGGTRPFVKDGQELADALLQNPDGIGWGGPNTLDQLDGAPAPSLESFDDPVSSPDGAHAPVALGAVVRHAASRAQYAGTYDAKWRAEVFPFLPEDFDERYHQCAPLDQQIDYPRGGEPVGLLNLVRGRREVHFQLPRFEAIKVRVLRTDYSVDLPDCVVDTLYFEPEHGRFSAVWRASTPIRRRIQEFDTIAIGPVDEAWWQNKAMGIEGGCTNCGKEAA